MANYVTKINGTSIAAAQVASNSPLAERLGTMETTIAELEGIGAFEVVPLTSGADPVPDVQNPSTKVIYLTKDAQSAATDPYTEWIWIEGVPNGTWQVIGETSIDLSNYKTKQTAVVDPSASGTAVEFISNMSQNENGEITVSKKTVQDASDSQAGLMSAADYTKLSGIEAGAQVNVKPDWNATSGATDEILNKPDLSVYATTQEMETALGGKQDVINDLSEIRSGATAGATAYQLPSGGIPSTDLATGVQISLGKADTAYQKDANGIPASDMAATVQTSLGLADTALQPSDITTEEI